jgi:hypothetical protein
MGPYRWAIKMDSGDILVWQGSEALLSYLLSNEDWLIAECGTLFSAQRVSMVSEYMSESRRSALACAGLPVPVGF